MRAHNTLETWHGTLMDIKIAKRIPSVARTRDFVTLIDEASGNVSSCYLKTKDMVAVFWKRHYCWFERQTHYGVRKIIFDGGMEYVKIAEELNSIGVEIYRAESYTLKQNGLAKQMTNESHIQECDKKKVDAFGSPYQFLV